MKCSVFFNRVLVVVLSAALYFSVSVPVFADVADWVDKFFSSYPNIYSVIKAVSTQASADNFAKLNTSAAAWRKVISEYNIPKDELRELFDICWGHDNIAFINKYGEDNLQYYDSCEGLVKLTIGCLGSTSLDDFFNVVLYGDSGAELDEDNNVKVPAPTFKDHIQTANKQYYPKNASGIMSYRTDERYHNICDSMDHLYYQMDFYAGNFGFSPVGGGNEMYIVLFYKTDTDSYYSKMQLHFVLTSDEVWAEDRDEIDHYTYTLTCEYWDMVDGSKETSTTVTVFENIKYNYFDFMWNSSYRITIDYFSDYSSYSNIFSPLSYKDFLVTDLDLFYKTDLSSSIKFGSNTNLQRHFTKSLAVHDSSCSFGGQCDIGYIASATPLSLI